MKRRKREIPVGLQLWTVRTECAKDFPGTIAKVAKMGYKGVEFAGYYERTAKEVRKMLDDNGLICCGSHTAIDLLSNEKFAETMEFNRTIGNKFVIVPWLDRKKLKTKEEWLAKAKTFNEFADKARAEGVHIGYHAHQGDFMPIEGETPWDILFGNTSKEVIMQIDTGNTMQGGGDPVAYPEKISGAFLDDSPEGILRDQQKGAYRRRRRQVEGRLCGLRIDRRDAMVYHRRGIGGISAAGSRRDSR